MVAVVSPVRKPQLVVSKLESENIQVSLSASSKLLWRRWGDRSNHRSPAPSFKKVIADRRIVGRYDSPKGMDRQSAVMIAGYERSSHGPVLRELDNLFLGPFANVAAFERYVPKDFF